MVIPASSGIVAVIMLRLGRVIGETMTVLMVTGNSPRLVFSWLQPVRTITATIAAEMGETVHYTGKFKILFSLVVNTLF